MHDFDTLDILRCPYCGGRLELVDVAVPPPQRRRDSGRHPRLPLLHLPGRRRHSGPAPAAAARRWRASRSRPAGRTWRAARCSASTTSAQAAAFDAVASSDTATYRDIVEALGPKFEGGYFLYRFSDPTYIVAERGRRARSARHGARGRRARDRHLRRLRPPHAVAARPVVAAAGARRPVLREGLARAPLHGAGVRAGVLRRQRADAVRARRVRLRDVHRRVHVHLDEAAVRRRDGAADRRRRRRRRRARVLIGHTHNERTWSPSHGQPLPPEGYAELFETLEPRIFGEAGLFEDVVARRAARSLAARRRRRRSTAIRR